MRSGWTTRPLGDVADFIRGLTFKPSDVLPLGSPDSIACFRTKNVQTQIDTDDMLAIPRSFAAPGKLVRFGDILVSTANSWNLVGKCSWVPELAWESTLGGFIAALRGRRNLVEPRYLYRWFSFPKTQDRVRSCARQTTNIANLSFEQCLALEIPLPPLDEQRRIAAILDQADALRRKRGHIARRVDHLAQAIFREVVGDPLTNDRGWRDDVLLGDLADIVSGVTKGRRLAGAAARVVPYLAVANVQDRYLALGSVKQIESTDAEIARYRLRHNDLLLTEGGDPDKLGRGALWRNEIDEAIHQNHVFRVRLKNDEMSPVFLNWLVGSERGKRYFLRSAKQTTGIASINMGQLKRFPLLTPPIGVQRRFERAIAAVEEEKALVSLDQARLDTLFASLQHRAFSGELTARSGARALDAA